MTTLQKKTVGYLGSRPPSCVQHTIFSRIGQATLLKGCVQKKAQGDCHPALGHAWYGSHHCAG
jgi:hypothetical protein